MELEGSSEYRTLLAGVVVMRLVDKWRSRDGDKERQVRDFAPVQQTIGALDDSTHRRALQALIDAISAHIDGDADMRVARLYDYGRCLESDARWDPAADVHLTAIDLTPQNQSLVPQCYRHASACFRKMGDLDRAEQLAQDGQRIARELGDQPWVLRLRITASKVAWYRGDLSTAERLLESVIADADAIGLTEISAAACHDLGSLAGERNEPERSARYMYAALKGLGEPSEKIRAMGDLAAALVDCGYFEQARALFSTVRESPYADAETRTYASLNMLYSATLLGERSQFDQLSRELRDQPLNARQRASYHVFLGKGYLRFHEPWKARVEFAEAAIVARDGGVARFWREAEMLLGTGLEVILDDIRHRRGAFEEAFVAVG
ncbi:MAG TPA: hypothetical protein VK733_12545 [Gemmatimonadaceae bacterium]|jgi:hypothetical protein|nr:hypothetical protein [Gemmatimonadaceae bacterium]